MLVKGTIVKIKKTGKNCEIENVIIPSTFEKPYLYEVSNYLGAFKEEELVICEEPQMKLFHIENVRDGKYTKSYELYYTKDNYQKKYEITSRKDLSTIKLGTHNDGITMIIHHKSEDKYLLLHEFRMSVNQFVFNVTSGLVEKDENSIDACIREVFEETGITITKNNITYHMPSAFSAIGLSDEQLETFFIEVDGDYCLEAEDNPNEMIIPRFYTLNEIKYLLVHEKFTSRTQMLFHMLILQEEGKKLWN